MENCQGAKCCGEPVCSSIKQENPEIAAIRKEIESLWKKENEIENSYSNKVIEKLISLVSSGTRHFIIKNKDLCELYKVDSIKSFAYENCKSFCVEGDLVYYHPYNHEKGELNDSDEITTLYKVVHNISALSFLLENDSCTYNRIYSLSEDEYNEILSSKYSDSKKLFNKLLEIMDKDDLDDDIFKDLRVEYKIISASTKRELDESHCKLDNLEKKEYSDFFNDVEKRIENESLIGSYVLFKDVEIGKETCIGKLDAISYDNWGNKRVIRLHLKNAITHDINHCYDSDNKHLYFTSYLTVPLSECKGILKKISEEEYYFMKNVWLKNIEEKEETTNP